MAINRQIWDDARKYKKELIFYELEADQFRAIWTVGKLSALCIIILLLGSSAFNWRSFTFLLAIGDFIPQNVCKWIAVPLAWGVAWAYFQQSFRKALIQIKTTDFRPTLKSLFMSWIHDRSLSILVIIIFGIFGALLFLWGETDKNEYEVTTSTEAISDLENQIQNLDTDYQRDRERIVNQIYFYTSLRLIKKEVKPREKKLANMKTEYQQRRDDLTGQLKTAKESRGKFRPTSFLSEVIGGIFWKRILVISLCAILLSSVIDLGQYSITTISVSRAFAYGWSNPEDEDEYNIFNIYNKLIGTKNATDVTINATEDATVNDTVTPQTKTMNNNVINNEDEKIIRGNVTHLNDTQDKMIQIIQAQIDKGAELGEINKTALANKCGVDRRTIYRNWDDVIKHISIPTNGKHQEETV
jgi:hypothetical protein